jgi:hypothetical protein
MMNLNETTRNNRGLIEVCSTVCLRKLRKATKFSLNNDVLAEIRTGHLLNTSLNRYGYISTSGVITSKTKLHIPQTNCIEYPDCSSAGKCEHYNSERVKGRSITKDTKHSDQVLSSFKDMVISPLYTRNSSDVKRCPVTHLATRKGP